MEHSGFSNLLSDTRRAVVLPHVDPDGDTLGSCLALCLGLRGMGIDAWVVTDEPIPMNLSLLPMEGALVSCADYGNRHTCDVGPYTAIAVDSGDKGRLGSSAGLFDGAAITANIDHHPTNPGYAGLNIVDPGASSTAEMMYGLLRGMGVPIDPTIAGALYVGVASDTGCFRYRNTTPATLSVASELVGAGADPARVAEGIYESKSFTYMKLLGTFLGCLETTGPGGIAWGVVSQDMMRRHGVPDGEIDGLVSYAKMVVEAEVAVVFKENGDGRVKVSLRSKDRVDVSRIASMLGGGGHKRASGATVEGATDEVVDRVLSMIREALAENPVWG